MGVLIALLFALPPLLDIRDVKPVLVLRHEARVRRRFDWLKIAAQLLIAGAIAALAGWMAGTYRNASVFVGGIVATVAVLHVAGTILTAGLARLRRLPSFVLRQGIGSLYRPGNQTRVTLFTVGLGALFVIAVRLMQVNLQQEYALDLKGFAADMFMIDIQPPQRQAAYDALVRLGATRRDADPDVARPRLTGITRSPANAGRIPANRIGGEYRLPIRMVPDGNESIVSGTPWTATPATRPEVAVEERYAEWTRLIPGDALVFEVAGRRVEAVVTLIFKEDRRIRSLSSLARSDVVGRPGSLRDRCRTCSSAAPRGRSTAARRARLQNEFLVQFPGVTLVDALDDIQEVRKRVADVSRAVSILGGFVLVCGILILVGSVAMTKMHRLYEAAVLKTLGAKRRVLVRITMIEYGVLGLLAGAIGSGASIAVTWGHVQVRPAAGAVAPSSLDQPDRSDRHGAWWSSSSASWPPGTSSPRSRSGSCASSRITRSQDATPAPDSPAPAGRCVAVARTAVGATPHAQSLAVGTRRRRLRPLGAPAGRPVSLRERRLAGARRRARRSRELRRVRGDRGKDRARPSRDHRGGGGAAEPAAGIAPRSRSRTSTRASSTRRASNSSARRPIQPAAAADRRHPDRRGISRRKPATSRRSPRADRSAEPSASTRSIPARRWPASRKAARSFPIATTT